jgi:predicted DNA-binding transcriptional regulator AlpA
MSAIQFIQITPEQLQTEILRGVKSQLDELKKHFEPKQPNEYLSRSEVSKMLGVDLSTLHNWNKKKILNPVCIGARVFYLRSEIDASIKPINV